MNSGLKTNKVAEMSKQQQTTRNVNMPKSLGILGRKPGNFLLSMARAGANLVCVCACVCVHACVCVCVCVCMYPTCAAMRTCHVACMHIPDVHRLLGPAAASNARHSASARYPGTPRHWALVPTGSQLYLRVYMHIPSPPPPPSRQGKGLLWKAFYIIRLLVHQEWLKCVCLSS